MVEQAPGRQRSQRTMLESIAGSAQILNGLGEQAPGRHAPGKFPKNAGQFRTGKIQTEKAPDTTRA